MNISVFRLIFHCQSLSVHDVLIEDGFWPGCVCCVYRNLMEASPMSSLSVTAVR